MAKIVADDLMVCIDCTLLIANGETGQGVDLDEQVARNQVAVWGGDADGLRLSCGADECDHGFSWSACDGCGSTLGGDRHPAIVIR